MRLSTAPRFILAGLAAAAFLVASTATSDADELRIWGKKPIKGKVISEDATMVKFKTESGEIIEVERSMIQKLITDEESAANEAKEAKKDEPKPETPEPDVPTNTDGPAIPTSKRPAGGWMMLLHKTGKVMGYRAVEVKRQGTGFVMEEQLFQLDESGRPHFLALATMTFGPEMQCFGASSRVLAKTGSRKGKDDTQRLRMGGGKVSLELQNRGAASDNSPSYDVPKRTVFRGAELALLLHGKLANDLAKGKEVAPMHIPIEFVLQNGGKGPDGKEFPLTTEISFEVIGVSDPGTGGFRTLALKVREAPPKGTPFPAVVTRYELAIKDGQPVKLLKVEVAGMKGMGGASVPRQTHAPMKTVQGHDIHKMIPPAWRNLPLPDAPDALMPSKEK